MENSFQVPPSTVAGKLGIMHLERYYTLELAKRNGLIRHNDFNEDWRLNTALLDTLGLGLEQTVKYIYLQGPTLDEFEQWVLELNGGSLDEDKVTGFNNLVLGNKVTSDTGTGEDVLTAAELDFWNDNGYVIVRNAVPKEDCDAAVAVIAEFLKIDIHDPTTWYNFTKDQQGIMVQLFQHPALEKNRNSPAIRRAYEQLWGRTDIYRNTDRVGFNPPETQKWRFPHPNLHWDVSLKQPIPFGTQGILYLSDTAENQGAFTLVPGFQHRVGSWLENLPKGVNPRDEDLYALGAKHIAANAGDFIIWLQALPHGASRNTSTKPRIVQYLNYQPLEVVRQDEWI